MERINKFVVCCSACFIVLFFLSLAFPNAKVNLKGDDAEALVAQAAEDDGVESPMDLMDGQDDEQDFRQMNRQRTQSPGGQMYQQQQESPGERMEDQIRQEQSKYYRSLQQDESQYYREVSPEDNNDPNFFDESHPLQEKPIQEEPLE